ncbi:MAG: hypothetical protein HDR25_06845 [Lachnospiraceae bacterium]|nr:hypothetical protein [Lachnospiraceae bacterium]
MSVLQSRVIQSLDGLSEDNLQFLLDMIQRFMKPANEPKITGSAIRKIGSLEGQDLIDPDYDIDECNDEIAEMFGVQDR